MEKSDLDAPVKNNYRTVSGLKTYIDIGVPSGTRNAIVALAE